MCDPSGPRETHTFRKPRIGYRAWVLTDEGRLLSQNRHYEWPTGQFECRCYPPGGRLREQPDRVHTTPDIDCTCGAYAHYDPQVAVNLARYGEVVGVMEAKGKTITGPERFRTANARVAGIILPDNIDYTPPRGVELLGRKTRKPRKPLARRSSLDVRLERPDFQEHLDAALERYDVPLIRTKGVDGIDEIVSAEIGPQVEAKWRPSY